MIQKAVSSNISYAGFNFSVLMLSDKSYAVSLPEIANLFSDLDDNVYFYHNFDKNNFEVYCQNLLRENVIDFELDNKLGKAYTLKDFEWLIELFAIGGNRVARDFMISKEFSLEVLRVLGKLSFNDCKELVYLKEKIDLWRKHDLSSMGDKPRVVTGNFGILQDLTRKSRNKNKAKSKKGYVYLIKNEQTQNVKIGYSANPKRRLKDLQTSTDCELKLIACIKGDIALEQALHQKFKDFHIRNEWFKFSDSIADVFNLHT